jgi:hypothetical protein
MPSSASKNLLVYGSHQMLAFLLFFINQPSADETIF